MHVSVPVPVLVFVSHFRRVLFPSYFIIPVERLSHIILTRGQLAYNKESLTSISSKGIEPYNKVTGISISRTTLIALFILSNARIAHESRTPQAIVPLLEAGLHNDT